MTSTFYTLSTSVEILRGYVGNKEFFYIRIRRAYRLRYYVNKNTKQVSVSFEGGRVFSSKKLSPQHSQKVTPAAISLHQSILFHAPASSTHVYPLRNRVHKVSERKKKRFNTEIFYFQPKWKAILLTLFFPPFFRESAPTPFLHNQRAHHLTLHFGVVAFFSRYINTPLHSRKMMVSLYAKVDEVVYPVARGFSR